ncbi:SIS domain-containing protein [Balneolales bacterium ANBcel1]|nr:SIS domain-containing protein [Balneolales bacterium ANBcel1]
MKDSILLTKNYLNRYANKQHQLARIINNPDPEKGLVHTPVEIAQQPFLWRHTAHLIKEQSANIKAFLTDAGLFSTTCRPHIVFTGAGTSDFVGQSLVDLFRSKFQTNASHWATPRITANPDDYFERNHNYILIHFARSGNSPESKAVLNLVLSKYPDNVRHIIITCNQNGEISRIAHSHSGNVYMIVLHEDSNDKGLAMTSSFSSMVVAGQSIAHIDEMDRFLETVDRIASAAELFIDSHTDSIYNLADPVIERAFFLGNKDLLGAATESALKVQELTAGQLLSKNDDSMSFRHGPISAVDSSSIICFYLSEDPLTQRYEVDVIKQYEGIFHEMGAKTIVVGSNHQQLFTQTNVQYYSYDPNSKWRIEKYFQVNLAVLFAQLFGMFQAVRRGINVDDPSAHKPTYNRVVQGVKLYDS